MESAALCRARGAVWSAAEDVEAALQAHTARHDYPDQRLRESIAEGDVLIDLQGERVGQINGLTQIDLGDYRFGLPVRSRRAPTPARTGLLNIEREVEMSGPIHDKGVFILHNYLAALFAHHRAAVPRMPPSSSSRNTTAWKAIPRSCAELYALLSSLSGLPLRQGIAVTGAVNQHGEVLPVGGINEKIEGCFRICEAAGLDGSQGVLIPERNRRHLMLEPRVVEAVAQGLFHIHTAEHVSEGIELLTGIPAGVLNAAGRYPHDSVLGHAQKTLQAFRHACHAAEHPAGRKPARAGHPPPRR